MHRDPAARACERRARASARSAGAGCACCGCFRRKRLCRRNRPRPLLRRKSPARIGGRTGPSESRHRRARPDRACARAARCGTVPPRFVKEIAMNIRQWLLAASAALLTLVASAQTVVDSPELYAGEKALYEAAKKEGLVVSFDTGPTWANWAAQFSAFKKRYPDVEIVYNDLGSGATVVALEKSRNRPQADTAYYFAASAIDAVNKGVVAPFKPVNFDKLPPVFRDPDGKWFTIHSLTVAFIVNTKLVKNVPQSWADLLKPEYKNAIVYLDPRSTGVGQVLTFAANFGAGGDMGNVQPGLDNAGKLWLNFIMTDFGQGIFAQGFVRPSVPGIKLPDTVADKLPAAPQVRPLDVKAAAAKKADIDKGWAAATEAK